MDLYLIRHTRVSIDSGICYGQSEVAVTADFDAEQNQLRSRLPPSFDRVISSPSERCVRLAALFGEFGRDARLLEYDFGEWEMRAWDDIDPQALQTWMQDFVHQRPPGGETLGEMAARVGALIEALRQESHQAVLLVTHAGVIRCVWAHVLGIPLSQIFKLDVGYGTALRVRLGENADYDAIETGWRNFQSDTKV